MYIAAGVARARWVGMPAVVSGRAARGRALRAWTTVLYRARRRFGCCARRGPGPTAPKSPPPSDAGVGGVTLRVAIVTDDRRGGWHGKRLEQAFRARRVEVGLLCLRGCRIALTHACDGLAIPGFEQRLPDGVFVRGVAGGTFEQVTLRLDVL